MNNKLDKGLRRGYNLNRPCCSCMRNLYGFRNTKRYCDKKCRYVFHRRADKQIADIAFVGIRKFKKRNQHLIELTMGPNSTSMWIEQLALEILGFRLEKCKKVKIEGKYGRKSEDYLYYLPHYRIFKRGSQLYIQRITEDENGVERSFKFIKGTHERYLFDPELPSLNEGSLVEFETVFDVSDQSKISPLEWTKLDKIFANYEIWRL